jgi:murein DD-endopeptidase MepM/ murein hydrolase activator NlpD
VRYRLRERGRALTLLTVLVCVPALILPFTGALAQTRSSGQIERDLREVEREGDRVGSELDEVRRLRQAAEEELAQIGARLEDARARLVAAEGQVVLAEEALIDAEEVRELAREHHEAAVKLLDRTEVRLAEAEARLALQLVESFKYGSAGAQRGAMMLEILRRAEDPNSFVVGMKQLQAVIDDQDATVERVFQLRDERSDLADDAALARREASQAAADAAETLRVVEDLREQARTLAEEIEADQRRQAHLLNELRQSESETASMLARVEQRQAELQRDLRAARDREAAERAAAGGGGSGFPGAGGGPFIEGMVCPVRGAVAGRDFINDWGYPRSGGRWHQGNDIFAARGTPVVAVHDATVVSWNPPNRQTRLGGITVTYETADGSRWYNAHLHTIAEGIAPGVSVSRGQVIGTVGNTGNARTTPPHLHLGRRYGGSPVNPWPTISQVCR